MPETLGTLVAFLLLVIPGLAFELMRERARPARSYTTFREPAVIVLASVAFSGAAITLLLLVEPYAEKFLPDPGMLFDDTSIYVERNTKLVARAFALEVILAVALAYGWHRLLGLRGPAARVSPNPAWFELTSGDGNPQRAKVVASVSLNSGTQVTGYLRGHDLNDEGALKELVLRTDPDRSILVTDAEGGRSEITSDAWHYFVIPGSTVMHTVLGLEKQVSDDGANAGGEAAKEPDRRNNN